MFTGIIESLGTIKGVSHDGTNVHFLVTSDIADELHIDQSVSHDGVCLTVTAQPHARHYTVTAVEETMRRTALGRWTEGTKINLERAMVVGARLDGHNVQGHVDTTGTCIERRDADGSWYFTFEYPAEYQQLLVDKGSVCINGVSLTVVAPMQHPTPRFSVAIIPYTFAHTTFHTLAAGDAVNLEFDVIGKYVARYLTLISD